MKVALINESSQERKNNLIFKLLEKVATKYHHEVFNYTSNTNLSYVEAGGLTGILLNSGAVDFVITGCATGNGVLITANSMPNVYCGYVKDGVDATLFQKINGGNAVSIPFGMMGYGMDYQLEQIFMALFQTESQSGYPSEHQSIQDSQREELMQIKYSSQVNLLDVLEELDKDLLKNMVCNEYFEEHFFQNSTNDELSSFLKEFIDSLE